MSRYSEPRVIYAQSAIRGDERLEGCRGASHLPPFQVLLQHVTRTRCGPPGLAALICSSSFPSALTVAAFMLEVYYFGMIQSARGIIQSMESARHSNSPMAILGAGHPAALKPCSGRGQRSSSLLVHRSPDSNITHGISKDPAVWTRPGRTRDHGRKNRHRTTRVSQKNRSIEKPVNTVLRRRFLEFRPATQSTIVVGTRHRAVHQILELRLGESALAGHLTNEPLPDISPRRVGQPCRNMRLAPIVVVMEHAVVTVLPAESLGEKCGLDILFLESASHDKAF